MYADLHMHTTHSDGTDTPEQILHLAKKAGFKAIAITDHDSIDGSKRAMEISDSFGIKVIPAIELTTMLDGEFAHILGYNVDFKSTILLDYIKNSTANMTETTRLNFEKAKEDGHYDYSWDRIKELSANRSYIGGTSVLKSMKHDKISPDITYRVLFADYFSARGKYHITYKINIPYDAIDTILAVGGTPIIAHPKLVGDDSVVESLVKYGAKGLEAYHPTNNKDDERRYIKMAKALAVNISGGTDWHGDNSAPYITHFGMRGLTKENYLKLFP